jgi:hypothetical protein
MDFKQYRLSDWAWIALFKAKYGADAYHAYFRKVCNTLCRLKPGFMYNLNDELYKDSDFLLVSVTEPGGVVKKIRDVDLCIKICCAWILENADFSFTDDYSIIKRYA